MQVVSDGAKHGLGKLLRDVCAKVVRLTCVLQMRRETVQRLMVSIGRDDEHHKFKRAEVSQDEDKFSFALSLGQPLNPGSVGLDDGQLFSSDCHKNQIVGVWEVWDPWLFLDRAELGSLSAACCRNHHLISERTPFGDFAPVTSNGADEDKHEHHFVNAGASNIKQ